MVVFGEEALTMEKIMELAGKAAQKKGGSKEPPFFCLLLFT